MELGPRFALVAGAACGLLGISVATAAGPGIPAVLPGPTAVTGDASMDRPEHGSPRYQDGAWATGDWGGVRRSLQDRGFDAMIRLTQSYGGVVGGARGNEGAYGGKLLTDFSFDLGKLATDERKPGICFGSSSVTNCTYFALPVGSTRLISSASE